LSRERTARHKTAAAIGKALLIYHLAAWVFMALNPWALPSGWIDILIAPAFLILFAFFVFLLPFDPVSLGARLAAFGLFLLALRHRRHDALWWMVLGALLCLGVAGLRVALSVARL
jgi:hypothetical protein